MMDQLLGEGVRLVTRFEAHGIDCAVVEHRDMLPSIQPYFCGYVRVPDGAEVAYEDCEVRVNDQSVEEHAPGGVTYNDDHLPYAGEPGQWIGFDTMHPFMGGTTAEEARAWTEELASAVAEAARKA